MENALKKSWKLCSLFIVIVILFTLLCPPSLAFEKVYHNSLGMEFALIPAGTFTMGSPWNEPKRGYSEVKRQVVISKAFYMQTTEVTVKQWRALMGKKFFSKKKGTDNMPVSRISWHDCLRFIKKLNSISQGSYRLPTEAEWEYACRAGSVTAYSWGNTIDCEKAMYENNSLKAGDCIDYVEKREMIVNSPAPVKSYPPNAWGLYDMHGNLWEWCQDWFGEYSTDAIKDPAGPYSGIKRIRRGGSWYKHGQSCRSANRNFGHPSIKLRTTGFRLVREIQ